MYDPVILIAVLDDIEQKTKKDSVGRKDLNPNDDPQYTWALDYLMGGNFVEWSIGHFPAVFFGVSHQGKKLRYELRESLAKAEREAVTAKEQRQANARFFWLGVVVAGVVVPVLVCIASLLFQYFVSAVLPEDKTLPPSIPIEKATLQLIESVGTTVCQQDSSRQ